MKQALKESTAAGGQAVSYKASWVWCGPGELYPDTWVSLEAGRIAAVGPQPLRRGDCRDLGQGLIMPGLVNAHTHLELSFLAGLTPPKGDFVGWVEDLVALRPGHDEGGAQQAVQEAVSFLREQGVALVGDITNTGRARDALALAGLSAVSFYEALGAKNAEPPAEAREWHGGALAASAVAAHSPYSVPAARLKELKARAGRLPFCLHLAESRAEMEFFSGQGRQGERLAAFLAQRGIRRDEMELSAPCPLEHSIKLGLLDSNTLAVHGVQLSGPKLKAFAATGASLCVCPRSNLGLTKTMAPVDEFLAAGVNLALGTDSLASAPDLSLWSEMAVLAKRFASLPAEAVLTMATLGGAKALGLEKRYGRLAPGFLAPAVFLPLGRVEEKTVLSRAVSGDHQGPVKRFG